jgi:hypothetical protein
MHILGLLGRLVTERWASKVTSGFLQPLDENAEFFKFDQSNLVIFSHILTEVKVEKWETFFLSFIIRALG